MSDIILDSIDLDSQHGFDLRAFIVVDENSDASDGEYPADVMEAYNEGEWQLVGIIVTASRAGTELGRDSIWNVEYGQFPAGDTVTWTWIDPLRDNGGSLDYYRADLIDNAIADARQNLTKLVDAAIDESIDG